MEDKLTNKILITNDNKNSLEIYKRIFTDKLNKLFLAETFASANEILEKEKIDLIITDIARPEGQYAGIDFIKEASGALVTGGSLKRARSAGLDPGMLLLNNDSYSFHKAAKSLVCTGPTGTNVNDIQIVCIY